MKSFLIAGIIFLCYGCNFSHSNKRFNGSWYACSEEGFYVELHIKNQSLKYSSIDSFVTCPFSFEFNGETLKYADNYTFKDSIVERKALINFENENCMKMYFDETKELWTWYRIEGKIEDFEADKELIINTQKRAKKYGCFENLNSNNKCNF